jgi:4-hydroxy-tetrahydrodipicolinate synthase
MTAAPARLAGCGTALVTPFNDSGSLDEGAVRALVQWQLEQGIDFLVPCGSTGEAATLTTAEHCRVVQLVVDEVAGRIPVVAGAGSNDTQKAVALSREMQAIGATHLLHTSPMYNKPPQRGIVRHYTAIAEAVRIPVVVYNVPGRTGSNVEARTTLELSRVPGIAAVKEASGNMAQITDVLHARPQGFSVLSGDDELTVPVMALGGDGVISVVSNVAPRAMVDLCNRMRAGDLMGALEIHYRLLGWMRAAFVESNPIPAKAALAMMGKIRNVLRSPLVPLADSNADAVRQSLVSAGVL